MRTSSVVTAAALIAVAVLVALAGPAASQVPGTVEPLAPQAFTRFVLPPLDGAMMTPTSDPATRADGFAAPDQAFLDPGTPPLPSGRSAFSQPIAPIGVLVKPRLQPAATSISGGGAWRRAEYSWYGPGFYGSGTACGQTYSRTILGVAHKTLPCGTRVTLRNPANGRSITVRVIDRGPYVDGRIWDLSFATCSYLDNCYTSMIQWRLP